MLAVGAAEEIIFEKIEAGRAAGLLATGPAILLSVLIRSSGRGGSAEMERARAVMDRGDLRLLEIGRESWC
jgi:hypothetical protein